VPTLQVQPRPTPEERADVSPEIEVDEDLAIFATTLEDWVTPRPGWEFTLHEGTDFGRTNNVEGHLLLAAGELTSTFAFRLDQVAKVDDTGEECVVLFEEKDGVAKLARLRLNGLDVELFHILTYT
jgi:hypothetical protein